MTAKDQFAEAFRRENATTRRVIHALPASKGEFKPYADAKTARELAFIFSLGQGGIAAALTNEWQWPPQQPATPATYAGVLAAHDTTTALVQRALDAAPESRLRESVDFFVGPKQMGKVSVSDLIWFMLMDSVHHRGQFSVYLRMAGEKVPSIYGPSASEPWM